MHKPIYSTAALIVLATFWSSCTGATIADDGIGVIQKEPPPVRVPLTMSRTRAGTYKATLDVRIGNLARLPFGFDTGSTGLHVFADAKLDADGSGVACSKTPTSVTYGNPPRIIFSGVMCYAVLQIGSVTTPLPVPIAYLTKASCPPNLPDCTLPDPSDPKSVGGYGVFGAGITGLITGQSNPPPPILRLPGSYGQRYSLVLTPERGDLILGGSAPPDATAFPLTRVTAIGDERWSLGGACLFVNTRAIRTCLLVSFDTGNGVAWIHNVINPRLPQTDGIVTPSTRIGFGPDRADAEATSIVAGGEFANEIHIETVPGRTLANTSIRAFFHHNVTYDAVHGIIYFAPAR